MNDSKECSKVSSIQLDEMFSHCMKFAQVTLKKGGELYPLAITMSIEGDIAVASAYDGSEMPMAQDIYQLLENALVHEASIGKFSAVALAADVNVPEQYESPSKDAIRVHIEARGFARFIYAPYEITMSGIFRKKRALVLHEPFSIEASPRFFNS